MFLVRQRKHTTNKISLATKRIGKTDFLLDQNVELNIFKSTYLRKRSLTGEDINVSDLSIVEVCVKLTDQIFKVLVE